MLEECHYGTVKVFSAAYNRKKLIFHGGGDSRGYNPQLVDVTISLNEPGVILSSFYTIPGQRVIYIPCKDMEAPNLTKQQYLDILDKITEHISLRKISIGIKCLGGHGRTGTVLSVYAGLLTDCKDPVKFVRYRYCYNAVETEEQIEHIEKITGKKTYEMPKHVFSQLRIRRCVYEGGEHWSWL